MLRKNDYIAKKILFLLSIILFFPDFINASEQISQTHWELLYVDSEEINFPRYATNSFDGDSYTFWHTAWSIDDPPPPPHEIWINLGKEYYISGFRYLPRQDEDSGSENGRIADYEFYVSSDQENWGTPVASGTFTNSKTEKGVFFTGKFGTLIRLVALSEVNGRDVISMAELNILADADYKMPSYKILKTPVAPAIDGTLDAAFLQAPKITIINSNGVLCDYYLLWNETALFGAVECSDHYLKAVINEHDGDLSNEDSLEIMFDTDHNGGSDLRDDDYKYWVNLLNTHADMKAEDKAGWNPNWTSAITLYGTNNIPDEIDTGYSLEWKINWSDWGISAPHAKDIWGLEISLNDKIWSVPTQTAWANTTSGDMDDPDGWGIALFCHEFQMDTLSWISEYSTSLFTGSVNNNVGQINCHAIGWDILQSLSIENLGTAKAGSEISSLKLWYQAGGGPFHPGNMQELGRFIPSGDKTWKLEGLNQQINNGDALYFTVDIQLTAQAESTCQFSLPKEEAVFQYSWPLEKTSLKNITSQVIQKQADFILDFIPLASVNLIPGVKNVNFGQIIINNVSGKDINLISLLTGLQDINYQDQNLDMVFERLWLKQGGETVKAIEAPFSSHGEFVFTPELKVANQGHITLELQGDIKEVPNLKKFRIGIPHNQSINRGQNILDPAEGKSFPILTGQVNIREPNLAATFSNFPNPFHAGKEATRISYCLESSGRVKIEVFNMHGARVIVLDDGQKIKGMYEVNWNGKNGHGNWVRNGVYLMRINVRYNNGCQEKLIRKVAVYR